MMRIARAQAIMKPTMKAPCRVTPMASRKCAGVSYRGCAVGVLGRLALKAGSALYIMTSAQDILFDLFVPALEKRPYRV